MKIEIELSEKEIKQGLLDKLSLKESHREQLYSLFYDRAYDEVKSEYIKIASELIKEIVSDLVTNYYSTNGIDKQVERAIENITKSNLIEILSRKKW